MMEFIPPKVTISLFAATDILTASSTTEETTGNTCTTELPPDEF